MNNLKKLRKNAKLTAKQAAKEMRVSHQALYFWESGSYVPSKRNLKKLSRFYKVSEEYILDAVKETRLKRKDKLDNKMHLLLYKMRLCLFIKGLSRFTHSSIMEIAELMSRPFGNLHGSMCMWSQKILVQATVSSAEGKKLNTKGN